MRKFFFAVLIFIAFIIWFRGYVRSGAFEMYLDKHPRTGFNSKVEYYWARILDTANHTKSAEYRYRKVIGKYPDTELAPLAQYNLIGLLQKAGNNPGSVAEGELFLEKYPEHSKAEYVRRKIAIIKHGY